MSIKFSGPDAFHRDVRSRVDRYFKVTGQSPTGNASMHRKTVIILAWLAASYVALVFGATTWWMALFAAFSLALAMTAVGFNIQHDGGHRSYSRHSWINRWMARTMDLVGGSSFMWDHKHNTLHHTYANIHEHDDDINVGVFGRLSPEQRRLWFHRLQHYYMWFLYGLLAVKWHLFDDFHTLVKGRIGEHRFRRPNGRDLAVLILGKVIFFSLALVIPCLVHPWWIVVLFYVGVSVVLGLILSVIFQLAHVVEDAQFPVPDAETERMSTDWAVHQVQTTVDFAPRNRWLTWYVGGLNYQIEHHLFPRVCHIHYPRIARIVASACERHGLQYNVHTTLRSGVASHFRWLREMGRPATA